MGMYRKWRSVPYSYELVQKTLHSNCCNGIGRGKIFVNLYGNEYLDNLYYNEGDEYLTEFFDNQTKRMENIKLI